MTQPTDPTDPRPDYPRTPTKADAKAAKAAYKASRPWYKKKRIIFPLGLLVLIVIIAASTSGGGGDGGSDPSTVDSDNSASASAAPSKKPGNVLDDEAGVANTIEEGKAYVLGDFKIHQGWKVDDLGSGFGYSIKKMEVENRTDDDHSFFVTIKLHSGAHRIVASIDCVADEAHPQDIVLVDCIADGKGDPYDTITIENTL
jgi:hypothetical protein